MTDLAKWKVLLAEMGIAYNEHLLKGKTVYVKLHVLPSSTVSGCWQITFKQEDESFVSIN